MPKIMLHFLKINQFLLDLVSEMNIFAIEITFRLNSSYSSAFLNKFAQLSLQFVALQ